MSKFFVGQRVRVVRVGPRRSKDGQVRVGDEAIVKGTIGQPNAGFHIYRESDTSIFVPRSGALGMVPHWTLEPITPEGHRACDEDFKRDLDRLLSGVAA